MSGVKSGGYTVTKHIDYCTMNCSGPTCSKAECNQLCIHMYTCDKACYDFNNGHICKHIHRVHSIIQTSTTTTEHPKNQAISDELHLEDSDYSFDPLEYAESIIPPQQGTRNRMYMYTTHNVYHRRNFGPPPTMLVSFLLFLVPVLSIIHHGSFRIAILSPTS